MTIKFVSQYSWGKGFRARFQCGVGPSRPAVEDADLRAWSVSQSYTIADDDHSLEAATENAVAWQCFEPYHMLTDPWREDTPENELLAPGQTSDACWTDQCYTSQPHCDGDKENRIGSPTIVTDPPLAGRWFRLAMVFGRNGGQS